jgi:hypothetical protein
MCKLGWQQLRIVARRASVPRPSLAEIKEESRDAHGRYESASLLPAGSHTYAVQTTDSLHRISRSTSTFTVVAPLPPLISGVVVAEVAAPKDGVLSSNEPLKITWVASDLYKLASPTLTVDGHTIAPVNGLYGGLYHSCSIGAWPAGSHADALSVKIAINPRQ